MRPCIQCTVARIRQVASESRRRRRAGSVVLRGFEHRYGTTPAQRQGRGGGGSTSAAKFKASRRPVGRSASTQLTGKHSAMVGPGELRSAGRWHGAGPRAQLHTGHAEVRPSPTNQGETTGWKEITRTSIVLQRHSVTSQSARGFAFDPGIMTRLLLPCPPHVTDVTVIVT